MSVRQNPFVDGECYHLYNRGNSKQNIFHDEQDHRYFMNLLAIMNSKNRKKSGVTKQNFNEKEKIISIGAFCLMPNHFHILVKQEKDNGISLFMQKLSTAYVMYYNKKYKRTGTLFEGKFKSKYSGEDIYLKYLFAYIHLNPLKLIDKDWKTNGVQKNKLDFLLKYPYSSFFEYKTDKYIYVRKEAFPNYFPSKARFMESIISWFKLND